MWATARAVRPLLRALLYPDGRAAATIHWKSFRRRHCAAVDASDAAAYHVFFRYSQDRRVRPVPASPPSAEAFAAAVERVSAHRGQVVVVKLGGSAMEDPAATDACLRSVAALFHARHRCRRSSTAAASRSTARWPRPGLTPRKVAGRRYTDEATLAIVVRVLKEINTGLVNSLRQLGCEAAVQSEQLHGEQLALRGPGR